MGRGCLFGDVVAAAVILPAGLIIEGVDDSKKLTAKKRDALYEIIMDQALAVSVGHVESAVIDEINIKQASRLAMRKAVEGLIQQPDYMLIDAESGLAFAAAFDHQGGCQQPVYCCRLDCS